MDYHLSLFLFPLASDPMDLGTKEAIMLRPHDEKQNDTLETRRLILRSPEQRDASSIQMLIANWEVAKMLGRVPYPYPDNAASEWVSRLEKAVAMGQGATFVLTEKARPLEGAMGCISVHRHEDGSWELGYWLGEPFWGQGYMGEAAPALVRHAFEELGLDRIVAGHFIGNAGSARVLLRCGFEYTGEERRWCEARGHEVDCLKMELSFEKWAAYNRPQAAE